jgi:hypothetical protein
MARCATQCIFRFGVENALVNSNDLSRTRLTHLESSSRNLIGIDFVDRNDAAALPEWKIARLARGLLFGATKGGVIIGGANK